MTEHGILHIQKDRFHATIALDKLVDFPIPNLRRLFRFIISEAWENTAAIEGLDGYLSNVIPDSKEAWEAADRAYQEGYRAPINPRKRDTAALETLRKNKRHTEERKAAKARYERWVKIQGIWNDMKH